MSGKGSKQRPKSVDDETFGAEFDRIFGRAEVHRADTDSAAEVHSVTEVHDRSA